MTFKASDYLSIAFVAAAISAETGSKRQAFRSQPIELCLEVQPANPKGWLCQRLGLA
jgi:hypothetical protein